MALTRLSDNRHPSLDVRVVASPKQLSCKIGEEAVILELESGIYYGLNPVASRVWDLLQEPRTIGEILASLLSEYEIEEAKCTEDLLSLLDQLQQWKLVDLNGDNGTAPH